MKHALEVAMEIQQSLLPPGPPEAAGVDGREVVGVNRETEAVAQGVARTECGLHAGNVVQSAAEQAEKETARDLWADAS